MDSIKHQKDFWVPRLTQKAGLVFILLTLYCVFPAQSEELDFSMNIGLEARGFFQDPLFSSQSTQPATSVFLKPQFQWRSDDRKQRFNAEVFLRWDEQDKKRSHTDLRSLYWSFSHQGWTTTVGVNKVFWGVTESVHLVDVINQTDLVEDLDQEDKLGQPMIQVSRQQNWGRLDLFVMPYFRNRTFAGPEGRFGLGIPVSDEALYESSAKQSHTDIAVRYSHYFGSLDVGLNVFDGTNREPVLLADAGLLIPYYQQMKQLGVDLQYTTDAWLWKLESIFRDTKNDQFWAAVAGFEYTFYQLHNSAVDLGVLLEYQHDERHESSAPTIADNDLFLATRLALNNTSDTTVLGGLSYDTENDSVFINLEAETRLNANMTAELRVRLFTQVDSADNAFIFNRNDYIQLTLNWYY